MSNYVITTDFRPKDSLPPGNPSKVIKGADFATEFEAIRDSIQTKADIASPTFTGVPAGPTPADGDNTTQLATTAFVRRLLMAGSGIASASTITPPAYGNSFTVTGTTTITAIGSGSSWDGRLVLLRFAGALTLTNSANLNLGGANITTTAGDLALFWQRTSGTWDLVGYRRANGALFGDGSALTNLNASNLASGTVPDARFPATLPAVSGANLTNLNASNLASGTVPSARVSGAYTGITQVSGTLTQSVLAINSGGVGYITLNAGATVPGYVAFFTPDSTRRGYIGGSNVSSTDNVIAGENGWAWEVQSGIRTAPSSVGFSATPTFNARASNVFYFGTLTGNVTSMTISNAADGQTIQIRFVQDGAGGRTVALPSGAQVSGSINTAANTVTWLVLTYVASASRWEGTWTRIS